MGRSRTWGIGVVGLAALVAAGCGQVAEKAAERATERAIESQTGGSADVDLDDGAVHVEGDGGTFSAGTGEVPAHWPEDVPLPDDLVVVTGSEVDDGSADPLVSIIGTVERGAEDLVAHFEEALGGWEVTDRTTTSGYGAVSAGATFERDGRRLQVGGTEADGSTSITLVHTAPRR